MNRITQLLGRGLPLGVLALGALLYLPTLGGDWVWDDVYVFRDNPAILEPWILLTTDAWGPTGLGGPDRVPIYRPLAMLSHVPGQWLLRGPRIERILGLALHLSIVWAVARFAQRLGSSRSGAWFGAALLACHPAASETVAWIAVRGDLLGVMLLAYGILALSFGRDGLAGLLLAVAPFCKETFLFAPLALLVWALALRRSALPAFAGSLLGVAAYLVVRRALDIPLPQGSGFASISEALAAIGAVAERAIELLLLPTAPDALHPFEGNLALGGIAVGVGIAAFTRLPGRPWLAALIAPLPLLAPSAPASMANGLLCDRYFYVLIVGVSTAAAFAFTALAKRNRLVPLLFALPLCLASFTAPRALDWTSNARLFGVALQRHPDSAEAQFHVAYELHTVLEDCPATIPLYERASRTSTRAGNNLQACLLQVGRPVDAARIGPRLADRDPSNPTPALNTARAWAQTGDFEQAEHWAREALRRRPDRANSHALLASILAQRGLHAEALTHFEQARRLAPDDPAIRRGHAEMLRSLDVDSTAAPPADR